MNVVPVERLTSRGDLFRCEPYAAVITARACLGRQESARRTVLDVLWTLARWLDERSRRVRKGETFAVVFEGAVL